MVEIFELLEQAGRESIRTLWFPLAIWTVLALGTSLALRCARGKNILSQYHGRAALLLALPAGFAASYATGYFSTIGTGGTYSAKFLVLETPIALSAAPAEAAQEAAVQWLDPMIWAGLGLALTVIFALYKLTVIVCDYRQLSKFADTLEFRPISEVRAVSQKNIRLAPAKNGGPFVAFSKRVNVPFTFGWRHSRIILPARLSGTKKRLNMALRHELMHIRHNDFLLNNLLMLVKALFWFHPLVHILYRQFKSWREISCDFKVIDDPEVSKKGYAQLLFDLSSHTECYRHAGISMAVDPSMLKTRIRLIRDRGGNTAGIRAGSTITILAAVLISGLMACSDLQNTNIPERSTPPPPVSSGEAIQSLIETGKKPLYVVDGEIIEPNGEEENVLSTVDPKLIKSIEVLKGEAAVQKFGTPGRDGAVIITLKEAGDELKEPPPPPQKPGVDTPQFFVAVEEMPKLKGSLKKLQSNARYPQLARKAGIEGTVIVQFIVNERGKVENPKVIRGIGGGCDEEALRIVRSAEFEPGKQRGQPVRVQYSLPIVFQLKNSQGGS